MTNQTARVLELLKRFNDGKLVCIGHLQNEYLWENKSEKTIRRDLDVIKEIFPNSFELVRGAESGCYKAVTKSLFENFLDHRTLSLVVQSFAIAQHSNFFDNLHIDEADKKLLENKMREKEKIYSFKNRPLENINNNEKIFQSLEEAIKFKKKIKLIYEKDREFNIKPYKILFLDENFYLASEVIDEKFLFSTFRISKIKEVILNSETFHKNPQIENFIKEMQTSLARYTENYHEHLIEVIVEIDREKANYFKVKKHLSSQEIVSKKANGALQLSYKVTQFAEITPIIKKWLPHMKVVSPKKLKDQIDKELRLFLEMCD
jgi:predicted DNA-binding transcriptional regulator YafY